MMGLYRLALLGIILAAWVLVPSVVRGSIHPLPQTPLSVPDEVTSSRGGEIGVETWEGEDLLGTMISGVVDQTFETLAAALAVPENWCEFLPLNFNVKSCTLRRADGMTLMTVFVGRKVYTPLDKAHRLTYRFAIEERDEQSLRVVLAAEKGPLGIRDIRLELEAKAVGEKTDLRILSSHRPSLRSRLLTSGYLSTVARNKVGFTVVGHDEAGRPLHVKGVEGMIERNAMRYYLALKAFLDTRDLLPADRFEAGINAWFDLSEGYGLQLHEMEKEEYLEAKRREREDRLREEGAGGEGVAKIARPLDQTPSGPFSSPR